MDRSKTSEVIASGKECVTFGTEFEKYTRGKSGEKRQRILDAAFTIFVEHGYTNTKMTDIAHAAGCGKSTLYEYFDSKDEILSELLRVKVIERFESLANSIDSQLSPCEKLSAYLDGKMDIVLEYGANEALIAVFTTHPEYMVTPTLMEVARRTVRFNYLKISEYITEGMEKGVFSVPDPYIATALTVGAITSYLGTITAPEYREFAGGSATDKERRATFLNLIFRALGAREK